MTALKKHFDMEVRGFYNAILVRPSFTYALLVTNDLIHADLVHADFYQTQKKKHDNDCGSEFAIEN